MQPLILWFRQDLRLEDNPALAEAAARRQPLIPVYILDDEVAGAWKKGGAQRWWLHHSLESLKAGLQEKGLSLILRKGHAETILPEIASEAGAAAVFWNRCYEPYHLVQEKKIEQELRRMGVEARSFNASLLFEPWEIKNRSGLPFKVYTPFWKACLNAQGPAEPVPAPARLVQYEGAVRTEILQEWRLLPIAPDWSGGLRESHVPGEKGAWDRWRRFEKEALDRYAARRDFPSAGATSSLSPHLHFGEIGPRQIWQRCKMLEAAGHPTAKFLSEIGWREFSYHLLYHFPAMPEQPFRREFEAFHWHDNPQALHDWQRGRTGYPLVDAGMRELWHTGIMHNRVRMIAASFLTKHLLIHWREGAQWFWDTLVDADLANNSSGWQWVAGCGADAAPYFRVFNPVLQSRKFDPEGNYLRRWLPELAALPDSWLHEPWRAPEAILRQAGVQLGKNYPYPLVDHEKARAGALAAYQALKTIS